MKQCTKCKQWKPLSEFHKHKPAMDGLKPRCKECRNKTQRQRWHIKKHDLRWRTTQIKARRQRYYQKTQDPQYKEQRNQYQRRYRQEHGSHDDPQQRLAIKMVEAAVKRGDLLPIKSQTCSECGKQANHYHHHKGYDKEHLLDVVPLCTRCHGKTWRSVE